MARATTSHVLHDVGLSAWFGGTLANAVALNRAASRAGRPEDIGSVANAGWNAWTPVNAAAIAAHLVGSVGLLRHDRGRMAAQQGVASMAMLKTGLTVGALGATAYSRALGRKVSRRTDMPASSATAPATDTPPQVASAQRQLAVLQWAVPALTGALLVVGAYADEQYRPDEVGKGLLQRVLPS